MWEREGILYIDSGITLSPTPLSTSIMLQHIEGGVGPHHPQSRVSRSARRSAPPEKMHPLRKVIHQHDEL
jgi:hypothetical protein